MTLLPHSAIKEFSQYQLSQISDNRTNWTIDQLEELGLNVKTIRAENKIDAKSGKNLVLIYMESLEAIYTDETDFKSLTPNLNHYKQIGSWFSDIHQTPGTSWTIAGVSSSMCGTPLLSDNNNHGNDIMSQGFLNSAVCLSDILHQAGYQQSYLGGASLEFAGKGAFLREHHYDDVSGLNELLADYKDKDYLSGWGFYDDTLFDMAVEKFSMLADREQPFNLTLLTLDTHPPKGHPSASCSPYKAIDNSMLHSVHCTDQLIGRFIKKISSHPAWKDTIIVLFSDHLSMRNDAEPFYPKDKKRKLSFIILNTELSGEIKTVGTHMDLTPTILELLQVKHHQNFLLGQNLLKKTSADSTLVNNDKVDKTKLYSAIRYVNSQKLTHKESGLCTTEQKFRLQSKPNQHLSIGNYNMALTYEGYSLSDFFFKKNKLALITFFDQKKQIKKTLIISQYDIPGLIKETASLDFILLLSEQENLTLYFGHDNELSPIPLAKNTLLHKLNVNLDHCFDPPAFSFENKVLLSDLKSLIKQCTAPPSTLQATYLKSRQQLQIPAVLVNNIAYSATLQKHKQEHFFTLTHYKKITGNQKIDNYCLPTLSSVSLHIPKLELMDKEQNITLSISKDNTGQLLIPPVLQTLF